MKRTASQMLSRFGIQWTITRTTGPGQSEQRTAVAVVVDQVRHVLGDSGVEIGDKRMLLEASANPAKGERIGAEGEDYVIVQVEPIRPAATTLAWWVWARRG